VLLLAVWQHAPAAYCRQHISIRTDEPITYAHHYPSDHVRPNTCSIAHNAVAADSSLNGTSGYIPFIGTSIGRDPQQLVLRLFYSTRDYPVKYFIVVVPEKALSPPHAAIWYELEHLKQYADNAVIIACKRTPSVAEGWNAGECTHTGHASQLPQCRKLQRRYVATRQLDSFSLQLLVFVV
jgi:hypothetical protein